MSILKQLFWFWTVEKPINHFFWYSCMYKCFSCLGFYSCILHFVSHLQVILFWSTMEWSLPPRTETTTNRRTTAPPSTMGRGGTETATHPTSTASTCAASTRPTLTVSSGPPGLVGNIPSSSLRWRSAPPATLTINKTDRRGIKKKSKEDIFWNIINNFWQRHGVLMFIHRKGPLRI